MRVGPDLRPDLCARSVTTLSAKAAGTAMVGPCELLAPNFFAFETNKVGLRYVDAAQAALGQLRNTRLRGRLGMKNFVIASAMAALIAGGAFAGETPSPEGATVYIVNIEDGASVKGPVKVVFGLSGMGVAPAGTENENTGHHHLLNNRVPFGDGPDDADMTEGGIYADENHTHFGAGQTETVLDLAPGTHTLQLVLGDLFHVPHNPPVLSEQITITVTE